MRSIGRASAGGFECAQWPDGRAAERSPHRSRLVLADGRVVGVEDAGGRRWLTGRVVLTTGTFLRGVIHRGETRAPAEREEIDRIIMDELVGGVFKPESISYIQGVIARMKGAGCDAVVLGCTELPLILSDANSALPTLDSTRLLARAALRHAG